jgi:threonine/homoserine/homoserine lactone efflux protein
MVVLDLVLIGLVTALEPIPLTAFILVLSAKRGTVKGLGFILGWLLSLVVVIGGVVLFTDGKPPRPQTAPSTATTAIKLALGVVLILIAVRQKRRAGRPRKPPTWMSKLDNLSVWVAASLGVLLQPWALVAVGAATVSELHVSSLESYILLVGFCLLCTSSLLVLELHAALSPEVAQRRLDALRNWIDTHRDPAFIILSLALGLWLVGHSIYLIVT